MSEPLYELVGRASSSTVAVVGREHPNTPNTSTSTNISTNTSTNTSTRSNSYPDDNDNDNDNNETGVFTIDDDEDETDTNHDASPHRVPLELQDDDDDHYMVPPPLFIFLWKDPWPLSVFTSLCLALPTLVWSMVVLISLIGRFFVVTVFALHLSITVWTCRVQLRHTTKVTIESHTNETTLQRRLVSGKRSFRCCYYYAWVMFVQRILDIILFAGLYPLIFGVLINEFFTEPDGTTVIDWQQQSYALQTIIHLGMVIAGIQGVLLFLPMVVRLCDYCGDGRGASSFWYRGMGTWKTTEQTVRFRKAASMILLMGLLLTMTLSMICFVSAAIHYVEWPAKVLVSDECDPMDETECWLPFPSCHFMERDATTVTGWRINLRGQYLPPLKGGTLMDPHFLNQLDGFSTMGPFLFYMKGLKEAHEAGIGQLQGHENIHQSVTSNSVTLLLNINTSELVYHSAEIDYLDPHNPLVLIFPAQPLEHSTHYAVAVVNAKDATGIRLPPSIGLTTLLANSPGLDERRDRFVDIIFPALQTAAPWLSLSDYHGHQGGDTLQMMFDFVTVSEETQLGPVRSVRDKTLEFIQDTSWGDWKHHVRVNKMISNDDCDVSSQIIARTIHAEMDVPWFLNGFGPGQRGAVLDDATSQSQHPTRLGVAKFVVHIPCSVRAAAIGQDGKDIRAIMEYGHGLFFSRAEASDHFLLQLAHEQGYIITAMDWRGMSRYDLLIVARTLLSTPRTFQAVRDNLIQGYANKYALQHFSRNGMLSMDWFDFTSPDGQITRPKTIEDHPAFVFYGISQGGILGAGYVALSGPTNLIDRAALGVPGTPFALIMSRSLDFAGYDALMLLNFYDNRHVRFLLALVQMAWDSVEGSGVLATPVNEPFPRMLLQAGLGDPVVPTLAAEALARGLGAVVLPNNPRSIFGVPQGQAAAGQDLGPHVTLTEMLYEQEYASLPADDFYADENSVHVCLRKDALFLDQLAEFLNTGRVTDPCEQEGGCVRDHSDC